MADGETENALFSIDVVFLYQWVLLELSDTGNNCEVVSMPRQREGKVSNFIYVFGAYSKEREFVFPISQMLALMRKIRLFGSAIRSFDVELRDGSPLTNQRKA